MADGTTEKIGKIVNQKMDVEVLSYDPETDRIVPRKVVNWFNNGPAEQFLQFTVEKSGGNGKSQFAATPNHLIRTPGGWTEAGDLIAGDRVLAAEPHRLSDQQFQVVLGSLMGDGNLSPNRRDRNGVRFRLGHGAKQVEYLEWKTALMGNIKHSVSPKTPRAQGLSTSLRCLSWRSCSVRCTWVTARSSSPRSTSRRSHRWPWPSGTWTTARSPSGPRDCSSAPLAAAAASRSASRR